MFLLFNKKIFLASRTLTECPTYNQPDRRNLPEPRVTWVPSVWPFICWIQRKATKYIKSSKSKKRSKYIVFITQRKCKALYTALYIITTIHPDKQIYIKIKLVIIIL